MPDEVKLSVIRNIVTDAVRSVPVSSNTDTPFYGIFIAIRSVLAHEEGEENEPKC